MDQYHLISKENVMGIPEQEEFATISTQHYERTGPQLSVHRSFVTGVVPGIMIVLYIVFIAFFIVMTPGWSRVSKR